MHSVILTAAVIYNRYRRIRKMTKSAMNVVKGMVLGAAAGAAVGTVGSCLMCSGKRMHRKKAIHAADMMSDIFDNMSYLFK